MILRPALLGLLIMLNCREVLGPVDTHLVRMIIAPMCIMASKLVSVLHARIATRMNSLSF